MSPDSDRIPAVLSEGGGPYTHDPYTGVPAPGHRLGDHPLSEREAADMIDQLHADPERVHSEADTILLAVAPPAVAAAYRRLVARCEWWSTA